MLTSFSFFYSNIVGCKTSFLERKDKKLKQKKVYKELTQFKNLLRHNHLSKKTHKTKLQSISLSIRYTSHSRKRQSYMLRRYIEKHTSRS